MARWEACSSPWRIQGFRAAGERLGRQRLGGEPGAAPPERGSGWRSCSEPTRSVRLTEPGSDLHRAQPPWTQVRAAINGVGDLADQPRGTLRLSVSGSAGGGSFLSGPTLKGFPERYPEVRLRHHRGGTVDIVAGVDAGVRPGEHDRPGHARRRRLRRAAARRRRRASVPREPPRATASARISRRTLHHLRRGSGRRPYRWEFTTQGRTRLHGRIEGRVATNDLSLWPARARPASADHADGGGRPRHIERGELVPVLEGICPPFPGFYLYYPQRRQASPPLRALSTIFAA